MCEQNAAYPTLNAILDACHDAEVETLLSVSTSLIDTPKNIALAAEHPFIHASAGIHPSECDALFDVEALDTYARDPAVIAIGETGLDYFYGTDNHAQQRKCFAEQIALARAVQKPLIIHLRDAEKDMLALLHSESAKDTGGVMHCFTGDKATAGKVLDLGFYISFSGILTFPKAQDLREVAAYIPRDRLLIETDCPYLAPVPMRGKPNYPFYLPHTGSKLAEIRKISVADLAEELKRNFEQCFFRHLMT